MHDPIDYYRSRVDREMTAASCAETDAARAIHISLATSYTDIIAKLTEHVLDNIEIQSAVSGRQAIAEAEIATAPSFAKGQLKC